MKIQDFRIRIQAPNSQNTLMRSLSRIADIDFQTLARVRPTDTTWERWHTEDPEVDANYDLCVGLRAPGLSLPG